MARPARSKKPRPRRAPPAPRPRPEPLSAPAPAPPPTAGARTWRGLADLESLLVPIDELRPNPENERMHSDRNVEVIASSLREFGQMKPVVQRADGVIVAGNGTWLAAQQVGFTHLARIRAEGLTADQLRAFGIVDNKASDLSEFDYQRVADSLRLLPEQMRALTGFADYEIEPLLQAVWTPPAAGSLDESGGAGAVAFYASPDQARVIREAIDRIKARDDGPSGEDVGDGRALELICADYLAGPGA